MTYLATFNWISIYFALIVLELKQSVLEHEYTGNGATSSCMPGSNQLFKSSLVKQDEPFLIAMRYRNF